MSSRPALRVHVLPASFLLLALAGGCGKSGHVAAAVPHETRPTLVSEGVLELPNDSSGFLHVEPAAAEAAFPLTRVYGRIAIRTGAVAEIGSRVSGRVESVHVTVGDRVRQGDPLVTLSSPDAVTARALARTARTSLDAAKVELDRVQRMRDDGAASERELALAQRAVSESEVEALRAGESARLLGGGAGRSVVLRSPIDGVVLDVDAMMGHILAGDAGPLVHVGDPRDVIVDANVYERDVEKVEIGDVARITGSDATVATGRVVAVAPNVDTATRTSRVRIVLDETPPSFRPGRFVRVEMLSAEPVVVVPATAVLVRNGREFSVYVREATSSRRFERRTVVTGPSIDGRVSIVEGVRPGELVVTQGALLLDGSADLLL